MQVDVQRTALLHCVFERNFSTILATRVRHVVVPASKLARWVFSGSVPAHIHQLESVINQNLMPEIACSGQNSENTNFLSGKNLKHPFDVQRKILVVEKPILTTELSWSSSPDHSDLIFGASGKTTRTPVIRLNLRDSKRTVLASNTHNLSSKLSEP